MFNTDVLRAGGESKPAVWRKGMQNIDSVTIVRPQIFVRMERHGQRPGGVRYKDRLTPEVGD